MKKIILLLLILVSVAGNAQKQKKALLDSKNVIIETATQELDQAMLAPEGSLYLFKTEYNIEGIYEFDITVHEKGKVSSVFCQARDGGSIEMQNKLKDFVKVYEFFFKLPKGKKYKFHYIFKF